MKSNKRKAAFVMGLILVCVGLAGCRSAESQPAGQNETSSPEIQTQESEEDAAAEAERQAEIDRLTGLEEAYLKTVDEKDDWADGVVLDSLNKLAADGVIAELPEDFAIFDNVFEFRPTDDGYDINYLDEEAKERLTGDFSLDLSDGSKVALCCELKKVNEDGSRLRDMTVPYTDKEGEFSTSVYRHDEVLLATPTLMPGGWAGTFGMLRESIPQEVFADSVDECRYLIAYGGCEANVAEDYYGLIPFSEGTIDRTDITTIVVVIDAVEREVLHIEIIGTDVPEASTESPYGDQLTEEAITYIMELLE